LTPIQHWFFEQSLPNPHRFHQSMLLNVAPSLKPQWLEIAFAHLLRQHDALRLRFLLQEGQWYQQLASQPEEPVFSCLDLSHLTAERQSVAISEVTDAAQESLNIMSGPLLRAVWLDLGADRASQL